MELNFLLVMLRPHVLLELLYVGGGGQRLHDMFVSVFSLRLIMH
jgi:hypothetical protein